MGLKPIRVDVGSDIINWKIQFTEASGRGEEVFEFEFHRPQYERQVAACLGEGSD